MAQIWHQLTKREQEAVLKSRITVGAFMKQYRQPYWCGYPGALESVMGCWSLMTPKLIKNRKSCTGCECSIDYNKKSETPSEDHQ